MIFNTKKLNKQEIKIKKKKNFTEEISKNSDIIYLSHKKWIIISKYKKRLTNLMRIIDS